MRGSLFYLDFKSDATGQKEISEPIGFDASEFSLKQEDKRMGRDVLFAGGNAKLEFSRLKHANVFNILQRYFETFGFESDVDLIIDFEGTGNLIIIGNLDFSTADNNVLELFKCDVILDSKQAIIKRRNEIKTDLFSNISVDLEEIPPVPVYNVLLKSVPTYQKSKWNVPQTGSFTGSNILAPTAPDFFYAFNWLNAVQEYGIRNTQSFIQGFKLLTDTTDPNTIKISDFKYITAEDNLPVVNIDFSSLTATFSRNNPSTSYNVKAYYLISTDEDFDYNAKIQIYSQNNPESSNINNSIQVSLLRGQSFYFWYELRLANPIGTGLVEVYQTAGTITANAKEQSYNTVNPAVRLYDAVRYVIKSISGLNIEFPMAEPGGLLYDQFIFNGNLLRGITSSPFYMTFKMIQEWFPELNLDYEIQDDGSVFIGGYSDFYANNEISVLTKTQFSDYNKNFNERHKINEVSYEYKNYRSQKESDTENGNDEVHGEAQFSILNKQVENQKEISVGFYRSALLIEDNRRKSMSTPESTATQDDDKVAIMDIYPSSALSISNISFNETSLLQHFYDPELNQLTLRNDGSFSFILLGIQIGTIFTITASPAQQNQGNYTVESFTRNQILLSPNAGAFPSSGNDGIRNTNYTYNIPVSSLIGINWSNEGFSLIENISASDNYYNLRFTLKRNLIAGYSDYLATCNIFHKETSINNTFYKNNPECITVYEGDTVEEGASFLPSNPTLSPYVHDLTFLVDFGQYKEIESKMRSSNRGFIRCFDARGHVLKVYPKEMKFQQSFERLGELKVIGEEKLQPQLISITDYNLDYILINGEYIVQHVIYEVKNDYFYIKDQNGLLLYNGVFYDRISVNGAIANSKNQLIQWLNLLT